MDQVATSPKIHAAIAAIMKDVGAVGKSRSNTSQGYKFRGIADVYLACQPVMAAHGVHVAPHRVVDDSISEVTSKGGGAGYHVRQRVEFRLYADDGSFVQIETTGEAIDYGDKASNKAMSAAMKYALIQAFAIPEDDPSVDTETADHADLKPGVRASKAAPTPTGSPDMVDVMEFKSGLWSLASREPALTANQQAHVKILQGELKIPDSDWRAKLFSYYGITSSTQLSQRLADDWITKLEKSKRARKRAPTPAPDQT